MSFVDLVTKRIAIVGFGIEGIAVANYLISLGKDDFAILDRNSIQELMEKTEEPALADGKKFLENDKIDKKLGKGYLDDLSSYEVIFRSPGISAFNSKLKEAQASGVEITSQIKMFFDLCPSPIIGVTGTKGKGTTSSLILEILKKAKGGNVINKESNIFVAGNIGYPALTLLAGLKPEDYVILELSSFQLMDLHTSPHIAVVTNLTVDHMDYHTDVSEYQNAKKNIVSHQKSSDFAILNCDSTFDASFVNRLKSNVQFFSKSVNNVEALVSDGKVILNPHSQNITVCEKKDLKLFGDHNLENIAAATLVADILGIEMQTVKDAVHEFSGLPHRLEFVAKINGSKYINDSFATNPEPTIAAIKSFSEHKILILGGSSKGADFAHLAEEISKANVKAVVLIGTEGDKIKRALIDNEFSGEVSSVYISLDEALKKVMEISKEDDVVIFSPACASFDMFKNYKDRGDKYREGVLALKSQNE